MWGMADDMVSKIFEDALEDETRPIQCRFDNYDLANIYDKVGFAQWAHDYSLSHPREGQPTIGVWEFGGLTAWCNEAFLREAELRESLVKARHERNLRKLARRQAKTA